MRTIHKFLLNGTGKTSFTSYTGSKIISAGIQQGNQLVVWVEVDTAVRGISQHDVWVYGTGWELPGNPGRYIGTVGDSGGFVWHIYEEQWQP